MKTIHKRLYQTCTVLPRSASTASSSSPPSRRVRSNSASSSRSLYTANSSLFFDTPPPPPPSSRPGVPSPARLPAEVKSEVDVHFNTPHSSGPGQHSHHAPHSHGQPSGPHPPFSLALASPHPASSPSPYNPNAHYSSFFPYSSFNSIPSFSASAGGDADCRPATKRHRARYHLDVGAYGIPKRPKGKGSRRDRNSDVPHYFDLNHDSSDFAVQVGEDAYFVRDNAMGVADGVGGWSRVKNGESSRAASAPTDPSSSALFARRLMHYCAEEVPSSTSAFDSSPSPGPGHLSPHAAVFDLDEECHDTQSPWSHDYESDLQDELEDSLEELEEGLDVLMILENAYEKALKAHVQPSSSPEVASDTARRNTPSPPDSLPRRPASQPSLDSLSSDFAHSCSLSGSDPVPLLTGSSTALLAVLDHSNLRARPDKKKQPISVSTSSSSADIYPSPSEFGAVIRIAHLGDCMGMLVRGEQVVWRTEEMWSNFNTPLQLGPSSSTRPRDAQTFTIPVQADDILILASDGLSDNLWDEEILDEVVRFQKSFLKPSHLPALSSNPSMSAGLLGRRTLAGMLSEALCSRARKVSECKEDSDGKDTPFARRAREEGRMFRGGKSDDISVLVALISPAQS